MAKLGHPAKDLIPEGMAALRKARRNNFKTLRHHVARTSDPDAPLNAIETRFVWLIAEKNLPVPVAYKEAGYTGDGHSTGYAKAKQPKIAKAIAVLREKILSEAKISKRQVLDGFLDAIQCARLVNEPIAMVAGWREIARICDFYAPKQHKIDISVNGQLQLEKLQAVPREQLLALVEGREIEGEFTEVSAPAEPEGQREQPGEPADRGGALPEEGGPS